MNIEQLFRDYNIPTAPTSHRHYREGWVSVECPFCSGNQGYHLGYNIAEDYFTCWRCGWKSKSTAISGVLRLPKHQLNTILAQYDYTPKIIKKTARANIKPFKFPSNTEPLTNSHRRYLINRDFDPDKIVTEWGILGTGMFSRLDNINYNKRIIIPYEWNGKIVTFQGRDITDTHPMKYLACPEVREIQNIKTILYGKQSAWTDVGIGVEGVTDVWRLGYHAVAVSGIKYKPQQVRLIAKNFKRFFVIFDSGTDNSEEKQAQQQARKLVAELKFRGVDAINLCITGDPGSMKQDDADALVRQLLRRQI
jgi:hypothetical protein